MDYKKILEGVVNIINTAEKSDIGFTNICTYIGENCPELRESEDEKMWKLIKKYAHYNISDMALDADNITRKQLESWLEKQCKCETDCHSNHQDANHPNGCITLEDFNGGEGFYKVHLDYLNEKQVEEIEEMIRTWNKESKVPNENIKSCIGMCLTDVGEQRLKDYNTSLKDCLAWLEEQGQKPAWSEADDEELEIATNALKDAGQYDSVNWLLTLKQRIRE